MGGGRKNPEKETSFKRSDSFKRISIRKNYLDRGAKKKQKNELANAQLFQEESKLEEYHITPSNSNKKKSSKESKVENIYMKAPQFMLRPVNDYEKLKEEFSERSSLAKNTRSREVCTQTDDFSGEQASSREEEILVNADFSSSLFKHDTTSVDTLIDLQDSVPHNKEAPSPRPVTSKKFSQSSCDNSISYKKYFNFTSNKTPEKIIIHVPASEDLTMPKSASTTTHALPSIPGFRTDKALSAFQSDDESHSFLIFPEREAFTKRDDSDDSAVEIFPSKDSVEILKFDRSPVFSPRQNFHLASPPSSLIPETNYDSVRNEEMRSLSVSLGRIWMDAPLAASAGSPPPPPPQSPAAAEPRAAHNSLDSALKANKEDPVVVNGLHKNKSSKTGIADMFSSKDSGFSFSLSSHKLTEFSPEYDRPNFAGGFFRSKKHLSGEVEGTPEKGRGSYRRISFKCKKGIRNSSKRKKQKKSKNDIYTVVIRRPPRSVTSMKLLDPLIFVPPEKRTSSVRRNKCYKYGDEIRICPIPDSTVSYETEVETDEDLYEYISADLTTDTLRFSSSDEGSSPREMAVRDKAFSKKASKDRSAEQSDSSRERLPYVPAGVSPVPARRPARRRPSRLARRKSSKGGKSFRYCLPADEQVLQSLTFSSPL